MRQDFTIVSSNETGIFRIHLMTRAKVLKGSNEASFVQFLQMRLATMLKSLGLWDLVAVVTESSTGPIKRFKEMTVAHVGDHG